MPLAHRMPLLNSRILRKSAAKVHSTSNSDNAIGASARRMLTSGQGQETHAVSGRDGSEWIGRARRDGDGARCYFAPVSKSRSSPSCGARLATATNSEFMFFVCWRLGSGKLATLAPPRSVRERRARGGRRRVVVGGPETETRGGQLHIADEVSYNTA